MLEQFKQPVNLPYRISQEFGANPALYAKFKLAGHNGRDYAVKLNTPVLASIAGMVVIPAFDPTGFGKYILLETPDWRVLYAHLNEIVVPNNTYVEAGTVIGLTGNTGNSTGPHLHFGVKSKFATNPAYNHYIDPRLVLA